MKGIDYQSKMQHKKGIGIYQHNIVLTDHNINFLVGVPEEPIESIAE